MDSEITNMLMGWWNWILNQLGWSGHLSWFKIVVLVLAFLGIVFVLRRLFGGSSGGSTVVYPPMDRTARFPTKLYTGSQKLSNFSIPKEVYNFKTPTPTPDLSNLRKPLQMNTELAKKLFIPQVSNRTGTDTENPSFQLNWNLASKLFIPNIPRKEKIEEDGENGEE